MKNEVFRHIIAVQKRLGGELKVEETSSMIKAFSIECPNTRAIFDLERRCVYAEPGSSIDSPNEFLNQERLLRTCLYLICDNNIRIETNEMGKAVQVQVSYYRDWVKKRWGKLVQLPDTALILPASLYGALEKWNHLPKMASREKEIYLYLQEAFFSNILGLCEPIEEGFWQFDLHIEVDYAGTRARSLKTRACIDTGIYNLQMTSTFII